MKKGDVKEHCFRTPSVVSSYLSLRLLYIPMYVCILFFIFDWMYEFKTLVLATYKNKTTLRRFLPPALIETGMNGLSETRARD